MRWWIALLLLTSQCLWALPLMAAPPQPPTLARTHRAALRFHGLDERLDRWSRRARLSNLLPSVEVQAAWQTDRDEGTQYREDQLFDATSLSRRDSVRQERDQEQSRRQTYGVKLRFEPGALIFDARELQAARHAHQLAMHRAKLLDQISELYHQRQKTALELALTPITQLHERQLLELELSHHDARLDALTGGWWSAHRPAPKPSKPEHSPS